MHQSIPAAPTPGTDKLGKCPAVAQVGGGGGSGVGTGSSWKWLMHYCMVINVHKTTHVGIPWESDICHFLPMVTAQNCTAQIGVEKATGVIRPLNNPDTPWTQKNTLTTCIFTYKMLPQACRCGSIPVSTISQKSVRFFKINIFLVKN